MLLYNRINQAPSGPTVEDYVTFLLTGTGTPSAAAPDPELSPLALPVILTTANWKWNLAGDSLQHGSTTGGFHAYEDLAEEIIDSGNWTMEIRADRYSTSTRDILFVVDETSVRSLIMFEGVDIGADKDMKVAIHDGTSQVYYTFGTTGVGVSNHYAVSWDGTTLRGFLNGVLVFSEAVTGLPSFGNSGNNTVWFGNSSSYSQWRGEFHDARIIKGLALYTANFTPPALGSLPLTGPL